MTKDHNSSPQQHHTTQTDAGDNSAGTNAEKEKSFFGIIVHSFFVVPFLIAIFCVLLFTAVRLLTMEQHTIYDYLNDVKAGSLTKRWQSAFELSKLMANPKSVPTDERFISELINAFNHAQHDDNRVRQYLALAMGRTGNARFVDPLLAALKTEKGDNLYAVIYALGMLRDKKSAGAIEGYLDDPDSRIRLVSVIALGDVANPQSVKPLQKALHDSEPNIGWDAAIALAKMKDASGKEVLLKLLNRGYLSKFSRVDTQEQNHILLVTIETAAQLKDAEINKAIQKLAKTDPNMNVRTAALTALK